MNAAADKHTARLALYNTGAGDAAIARAEGVSHTTIGDWRKRHGLPANAAKGELSKENAERRLSLYHDGLSDHEIARIVGVHPTNVSAWRRRQGLPANGRGGNQLSEAKKAARMRRYERGYPDHKIAAIEGVVPSAIEKWRRYHGLTCLRGQAARKIITRDTTAARLRRAVGWGIAPDIADEAIGEMMLALTEGRLSHDQIEAEARRYVNKAIGMFASHYGPRSIDEEIGDDGFRMIDLIADESASSWLEEMGASAW